MAGNETKITDIVGKEAFDQIRQLKDDMGGLAKEYVSLAKKIGDGLKFNPKNLIELSQKVNDYSVLVKQINVLTIEYNESAKKKAEIENQLAQAAKAMAEADLIKVKTEREKIKLSQQIENQNKKRKVSEEELTKIMQTQVNSIRQAEAQNARLRQAVKDVEGTDKEAASQREVLNQRINQNTSFVKSNTDAYVRQKMEIGTYRIQIKQAWSELQNGNNVMQNASNIARGYGNILRSNVANGLNTVKIGVTDMIKGFVGAQAVLKGLDLLFSRIKSGIGSVMDFEAANSKLAAILGTTRKEIRGLEIDAKRLGATTKYTASEATELQIELAKLGFTQKEIRNTTEYVLKFAQATGSTLADAAALSGAALRMFNAETSETERYVSAMAVATTKSALSFSYLQTAIPIVGPVAKAFNFTIEDTLALLGKLSDAGFDASMAATASRNIILNLADANGKLAKELGGNVKTLPELVNGLVELRNKGIDLNSTLELTDKRSVAAFNAFLTGAENIGVLRDSITGVDKELDDMANTMSDNVKGAIAGLESAWEAFMLSFENSTGPAKKVIDFLANGIRSIANSLAEEDELIQIAETEAIENQKKQMKQFDVEGENIKRLKELYRQKVESGMSEDEAEQNAKEEYLLNIQSNLDKENIYYQSALDERKKTQDEYENSSFLKQALFMQRTNAQFEKDLDLQTYLIGQSAAEIYKYQELIKSVTNTPLSPKSQSVYHVPTEAEKREQEKAAKEAEKRRKLELEADRNLQESKIKIMEEGYEKERAELEASFQKRIDDVKTKGVKVNEQIAAIEAERVKRLSDFQDEYDRKRTTEDIQNRIAIAKKGSEEELKARLDLLDVQKAAELKAADKIDADKLLIERKYDRLIEDEKIAYGSNLINIQLSNNELLQSDREIAMDKEISNLTKQYSKGVIKKEQYEKEKADIEMRYAKESLDNELSILEKNLDLLSGNEKIEAEKKIASIRSQLSKLTTDGIINDAERELEARKKVEEAKKQLLQETFNAIGNIGNSLYQRQIDNIEFEIEANQDAYDRRIEEIEGLAEKDIITTEEAEARKRAAEEETSRKNKELEKKKAELQTRQAKFQKAIDVGNIIMNTAMAVMSALAMFPPNVPLSLFAAATGAVQLATVLAQPIPKYAHGTDNHPGGLAIVGDGGRSEAVLVGDKAYITPDKPTLLSLPAGAEVVPDLNDPAFLSRFVDNTYWLTHNKKGEPVQIVNNFDTEGIIRANQRIEAAIYDLGRTIKKSNDDAAFQEYKRRKMRE